MLMLIICSISLSIRAEQETIDWSANVDFDQFIQEFSIRNDLATTCDNDTLKNKIKQIFEEGSEEEHLEEIIIIMWKILDNCPIDIDSHLSLQSMLSHLGKETSAEHHLRWANGLAVSIIEAGDGHTPQTAHDFMILVNMIPIFKFLNLEVISIKSFEYNDQVIGKYYASDKEENIKIIYFNESRYIDLSSIEEEKFTDWSKEVNFDIIRDEYISKNIIHRCRPDHDDGKKLLDYFYKENNWEELVNILRVRLKTCPVDMKSHYKIAIALNNLERFEEAAQHERWLKGLMNSITNSSDGKTPETAYRMISVSEEYDFMWVNGIQPLSQAYVSTEYGAMDLFEVTDKDGEKEEIYFSLK